MLGSFAEFQVFGPRQKRTYCPYTVLGQRDQTHLLRTLKVIKYTYEGTDTTTVRWCKLSFNVTFRTACTCEIGSSNLER